MLGLPLSTAVTVILLVVLLMVWRRSRRGHASLRLDRLTCVSRNRTFLSRLVARVDVRFWHQPAVRGWAEHVRSGLLAKRTSERV